jgi:hypothetical protein
MFDRAKVKTSGGAGIVKLSDILHGQWAEVVSGQQAGSVVFRPGQFVAYVGMGEQNAEFVQVVGDTSILTFENWGGVSVRVLTPGEVVTVAMNKNCGGLTGP